MFKAQPPGSYYAVIFSSLRTPSQAGQDDGYDAMADRMGELAAQQPGYLGAESVRGSDRFGITISYWTDEASIASWKRQAEHKIAQETGNARWYADYVTRIAKVERAYAKR